MAEKPIYVKHKGLCADGVIRPVYSQLSKRSYANNMMQNKIVGHVKVGMVSVSGELYFTEEIFADHTNEAFVRNMFEAYPGGVNADMIGTFWSDWNPTEEEITSEQLEAKAEEFINGT